MVLNTHSNSIRLLVHHLTAREAREMLAYALEHGLQPVAVTAELARSVVIWLSQPLQEQLHSSWPGVSDGDRKALIQGLVEAGRQHLLRVTGTEAPTVALSRAQALLRTVSTRTGREDRPAQREMVDVIGNQLRGHGVQLIEAATGTGKTLAAACAIVEYLDSHPGETLMYAVPTVALSVQVISELGRVASCGDIAMPAFTMVLGRSQFVSSEALEAHLSSLADQTEVKAVLDWIADQESLADPFGLVDGLPAWSVASLERLCGEVAQSLRCDSTTPPADMGVMAYAAQFERARASRLLIGTHAMLALHSRLRRSNLQRRGKASADTPIDWKTYLAERAATTSPGAPFPDYASWANSRLLDLSEDEGGVLPAITCLLVDEVHAFESAVALMSGSDLSLSTLTRLPDLPASVCEAIGACVSDISANTANLAEQAVEASHPEVHRCLTRLADILSTFLGRKTRSGLSSSASRARLQYGLAVVRRALAAAELSSVVSVVELSPVRRYPRLRVGPRDLRPLFDFLWRDVRTAVGLSATILVPRMDSSIDSDAYVAMTLAISPAIQRPAHRIMPPPWLTSPVTVLMSSRQDLQPSAPDALDEVVEAWWTALASYVDEHVVPTSAGGVLVLCTSYDTAQGVASRMRTQRPIVVAVRDSTVSSQRQAFEKHHAAGHPAVWLAIGAAVGTGVDLVSDGPAAEDTLLTDVVVPRLPFRVGESLASRERSDRMGFWVDVSAMLITLRQWAGRLVRRPGNRPNRRLWILDPRAVGVGVSSSNNYAGVIQRLFDGYSVRRDT